MDIREQVNIELHKIHRTRNRIAYIPNPLILFVALYFQRASLKPDIRWWAVIILVMVGTILRVLVGECLFEKWTKHDPLARSLNLVAFLFLGVGWGLHFADIYYHFGLHANNLSYTLLVIAAYTAAASTSLIADKGSYYTFVVPMVGMTIGTYLINPTWQTGYIIITICVYLMFSVSSFKLSHKQLCDLLESRLRSEQERLRMQKLIDTVPGFVGIVDKNRTIVLANANVCQMYPGIIGKKIGTIDPKSSWETDMSNFMDSDETTSVFEGQSDFTGDTIHALLNVQKLEDGGAIIVSIITTELVEAREKLREQEAKAQYTAKLASLGEMAAGIAHEVNNPLTIIQGSANIVRRLIDKDPIDIENVKILTTKMIETSDRISKTVKSLKALSRNAENDPKVLVDLNKVIYQSVDIAEQKCRSNNVELRWDKSTDSINVLGREAELMQVFTNLIGNAVDAIKERDEKWIEVRTGLFNQYVDVYFTDSGLGIPPEIQKKIMEPFFTTKDVNQGTGLGLSISKNIIKTHDGELTLVTEAPHTTFRVRLPIAHE